MGQEGGSQKGLMVSEKVVPDQDVSTSLRTYGHRMTQARDLEGQEVVVRKWGLKLEVSEEFLRKISFREVG